MEVLNFDEVGSVSGGITETQCVSQIALGSGIFGACWGSPGGIAGAWAGFEAGAAIGSIVGTAVCGYYYN